MLIVVTGGLVRLTGSGSAARPGRSASPGSYVPVQEQAEGFHKYIEFGNRTLTGVVGLTALAALVVTSCSCGPDVTGACSCSAPPRWRSPSGRPCWAGSRC